MYAMLVRQAVMAMGISDPQTLAMVDRILSGGFENPQMMPLASDSISIPEGAETLVISATQDGRDVKAIFICEKKS